MGRKQQKRASKAKRPQWRGWGWLRTPAALVLLIPPGLAVARATVLGFGTADLVGHLLLDTLVCAVFFPLLSNRVMAESWEPRYFTLALSALALYVAWLYLPAGIGTASFLGIVTLVSGGLLRVMRQTLWQVRFVRGDPFLNPLKGGDADMTERPKGAADAGTWGAGTSWTRYIALPILIGLLAAFIAIRVARPMDKRAAAQPVLGKNRPFEIAQQFLKAATNGNAPLFARENAIWYVLPERRRAVMRQAASLFSAFKRETNRLDLIWADLGTAKTKSVTGMEPSEQSEARLAYNLGGSVHAWLEDAEAVPAGAREVGRPGYGEVLVWVTPVRVEVARQADGSWRVSSVGETILLHLTETETSPR